MWYGASMSETSETKRLADAINVLAITMTEIMTERLRAAAEGQGRMIAQAAFDTLLNKGQVAERLNVSVRAVDVWMARGLLRYMKIGRSVRFKWSEVEHQLQRLAVGPWR